MEKDVVINGTTLHFKSTGATPIIYRNRYKRDMMVDMQKLAKEFEANKKNKEADEGSNIPIHMLETFERVAHIMHCQGDPEQPKDIVEWADQFEVFNIYEILPDILDLWQSNNQQLSTAKKKAEK